MRGGMMKGLAVGVLAGMVAGMAAAKTVDRSATAQRWMRKGRRAVRTMKNMF